MLLPAITSRCWDKLRPVIVAVLAEFVPDPREVIGEGTVVVDGTICPTQDWAAIPDVDGVDLIPIKKLPGTDLNETQAAFNTDLSSIRAAVAQLMLSEEAGRYRCLIDKYEEMLHHHHRTKIIPGRKLRRVVVSSRYIRP